MKRAFISTFMLCAVFFSLHAQNQRPPEVSVIPPSPNVAAMNKFVDLPVSHYTGTPSIQVPIYVLKTPQLSLPINLSYHASGWRVEEHASWVGAGWSLNAGGTISRTVRGLPDEYLESATDTRGRKGYLYNDKLFLGDNTIDHAQFDICDSDENYILTPGFAVTTADSVAQGLLDLEPDLFSYNFPGGSGKFVLNRDGQPVKYTLDDIQFTQHVFSNKDTWPVLEGDEDTYVWVLTGADGTQYTFGQTERTFTETECGNSDSPYTLPTVPEHQSTWYLQEISNNGDWIRFEYEDEIQEYNQRISTTGSFRVKVYGDSEKSGAPSTINICSNKSETHAKRLSRITSSNGYEVLFQVSDTDRVDLMGSKKLEEIIINRDDNFIQKFRLSNDTYFGSNTKLKLDAVVQQDADGNSIPGYEFEYERPGNVPPMNSKGQDYWGFNNTETTNPNLIPRYRKAELDLNKLNPANRSVNLTGTRVGMLKTMTYPTGGTTSFIYESHEYAAGPDDLSETTVMASASAAVGDIDDKATRFTLEKGTYVSFTRTSGEEEGEDSGYTEVRKKNESTGEYESFRLPTEDVTEGGTPKNRRFLEAGDYELYVFSDGEPQSIKAEYEFKDKTKTSVITGGLRIKTIVFNDPLTNASITKSYTYRLGESQKSSGRLFIPAIMGGEFSYQEVGTGQGMQNTSCTVDARITSVSLNTNSIIPTGLFQGGHIGYSEVKEFYGIENVPVGCGDSSEPCPEGISSEVIFGLPTNGRTNGMIVHQFINEQPEYEFKFPLVIQNDISHRNSKKLSETVYANEGGSLNPLTNTRYIYEEQTYEGLGVVWGMNLKRETTRTCFWCGSNFGSDFKFNRYKIEPKWHYLAQTIETEFDQFERELTTAKQNEYASPVAENMPPPHFQPTGSSWLNSQGNTVRDSYIRDAAKPELILRNERFVNDNQISGIETAYHGKLPASIAKWDRGGTYYPLRIYSYDNNKVVSSAEFPIENDVNQAYGLKKAYIWAYGNEYPVAEISNISFDELESLIGAPSLSAINGSFDNEVLKTELESIRTALPQGAFMKSFLYTPWGGTTSQISVDNLETKYTYDSFNRLRSILDKDDNVLKVYDYAYRLTTEH